MKNFLLPIIIGLGLVMSVQASEDELVGSMLFIVNPVNEDPESYESAVSVCNCALQKAKKHWASDTYNDFTADLLSYAKGFESSIKSPDTLSNNNIPEKSENLVKALEEIAPFIIECEKKFQTRVEF